MIGYELPQLESLIFPGYADPFVVTDPAAAVNAEAARLGEKVDAVVAAGHIGGDGTVLTAPTGQLMDLANAVTGVDVLLGGHTHTEYITTAPNGVLVAESPNSGTQFTRIRITVDTHENAVVYKTADTHRRGTRRDARQEDRRVHRRPQQPDRGHLQRGHLLEGDPARPTSAGAPTGGCASR